MRTTTIICCALSAVSSFSYAAPTIVSIDSGAIIEEAPKAGAVDQGGQIHRFMHKPDSKDSTKEPVDLWIDDFGNIEEIPAATSQSQAKVNARTGSQDAAQKGLGRNDQVLEQYSMIDAAYTTGFMDGLCGSIVYSITGLLVCLMMVLGFTMFDKRSRSALYIHEKDVSHGGA